MEPQRIVMEEHMIFATFVYVLRRPQMDFEAASNGAATLCDGKTYEFVTF